ncbi:hypothetical protein Kpol_1038p17 [Vanderwaltozyma polyspora DSM 70294]|uniref:Low affinity vacuolar monovalent cation/H(+) antiporter n=1 Tax=Vanderwaltozyma polyspora (strain ATCC 22028 / DSM 70294 / BCRC 21397 / CBS 2163 / NBRC 10782 / NRRL Y-8283 / UCD 57-17) TaxID=436907 RepID=A7TR07_VANPO|nr:uncharacterized protein Kpol_1038p17 [Vanderwaltozyma polyspora DSM 70294]EDO15310.1 hypothetical protein Kpol_1038p17 [Vanderwaltozyma polyspora DSM 70294]
MSNNLPTLPSTDHARRVFSVEDDPNEIKQDIRDIENLTHSHSNDINIRKNVVTNSNNPSNDNLISPIYSSKSINLFQNNNSNGTPSNEKQNNRKPPRIPVEDHLNSIHSMRSIDHDPVKDRIVIHDHTGTSGQDFIIDRINVDHGDDRISNVSSTESFTLRERQDAINETHPFGIRIWKPALYKKQRSVQKTADQDIHETKIKILGWYVHLSNFLWSVTCGIILFILCYIAGILVPILGFFTKSSRAYAAVFFKLARYLLWPFGKVVYLIQDDRYLIEDNNEGISAQQFFTWITSYGKMFSGQQLNSTSTNQHHSYESLRDMNRINQASYGSIQQFITDQQKQNNNSIDAVTEGNNRQQSNGSGLDREASVTDGHINHRRYFGRGEWTIGRLAFYVLFYIILQPIVLLLSLITWLFVFTIPMSNILWKLSYHLRRHPLALDFKSLERRVPAGNSLLSSDNKNVILCTFRCAGLHYYKYTVDGTNVIVMNLIAIVFFTIFDFYVIKNYCGLKSWLSNESTIFVFCLISITPLAFYIGQAVASISAQTSMGVGAAINAFFSTVVEIFLYCVALQQRKGLLVEGSMIGSILGAVLMLPGLSMCSGAFVRKTQRYNPASAGVSSALLIFSMIVMFFPTILYEIYGGYIVTCEDKDDKSLTVFSAILAMTSEKCYFSRPPLKFDKMYKSIIQPMSITSAVVLFLAYFIGLWFTLRTHAKLIWQLPISDPPKETGGVPSSESNIIHAQDNGHDGSNTHEAPNWSRSKSTWILLLSTLLYAIIAEILVSCVDSILEDFPSLNPKFLGLTIFALVPNTTEFLNAISFAMHGNVALSMEIGSAYALQVCLLQIPALVLYSFFHTWNIDHSLISIRDEMFPLVFPRWDLVGSMTSVFLFTYLYAEGKSNYFKGSILILLYIAIIIGFYFQGLIDSNNSGQ